MLLQIRRFRGVLPHQPPPVGPTANRAGGFWGGVKTVFNGPVTILGDFFAGGNHNHIKGSGTLPWYLSLLGCLPSPMQNWCESTFGIPQLMQQPMYHPGIMDPMMGNPMIGDPRMMMDPMMMDPRLLGIQPAMIPPQEKAPQLNNENIDMDKIRQVLGRGGKLDVPVIKDKVQAEKAWTRFKEQFPLPKDTDSDEECFNSLTAGLDKDKKQTVATFLSGYAAKISDLVEADDQVTARSTSKRFKDLADKLKA